MHINHYLPHISTYPVVSLNDKPSPLGIPLLEYDLKWPAVANFFQARERAMKLASETEREAAGGDVANVGYYVYPQMAKFG